MEKISYTGNDLPFAFVSYSHTDSAKVKNLLRLLYRKKRRFWYDDGIPYSRNWQEIIDERLTNSSMFLLFMTNGIEQRREIIREIRMAIDKRKENDNYKIIVVMLERVPVKHLFGKEEFSDVLQLMESTQYLAAYRYGGITVKFAEVLTGAEIWESCMTPQEIDEIGNISENRLSELDEISENSDYIYKYAQPRLMKNDNIEFYALERGETDPNTVYPICIDDQWIPEEFFSNPDFRTYGFTSKKIREKCSRMQQYEMISSLMHNWQVLINRASIFNSEALAQWYMGEESESFRELLGNGSVVIYLMGEKSPVERPADFEVVQKQFESWCEICRSQPVFCIRMSWDDYKGSDYANKSSIKQLVANRMMQLLLTTANDEMRLDSFRRATGVPDEKSEDFKKLWQELRNTAVKKDDAESGRYTRSKVYKDFLILEGREVTDCILDYDKPFVCELKKIIDFSYAINLPFALYMTPFSSYHGDLWDIFITQRRMTVNMRVISADEIFCAVANFNPEFLTDICFSEKPEITLSDVAAMRRLPSWTAYIESLDACKKRANLNEIDFYDVEEVWKRYAEFLEDCRNIPQNCDMKKHQGCLSVIYSLGDCRFISVYRKTGDTVRIETSTENFEKLSENPRENVIIDFVCGDILKYPESRNCFLQKLRMFEGILMQSARISYDMLVRAVSREIN